MSGHRASLGFNSEGLAPESVLSSCAVENILQYHKSEVNL